MPSHTTMGYHRANYNPSNLERVAIKGIISEATLQLQSYDEELIRLHNIREKLRQERELLLQHITNQRSLIAPIRALPLEILEQIFALCCPNSPDDVPLQSICQPLGHAPLNIGLVCHLWRDIVVTRPEFWSNIALDLSNVGHPGSDWEESCGLLDLYLERSQQSVLTVALYAPLTFEEQVEVHLDNYPSWSWRVGDLRSALIELVRTITAHADRWRHLQLMGFAADYLRATDKIAELFRRCPLLGVEFMDRNLCDYWCFSFVQHPNIHTLRLVAVDLSQPFLLSSLYFLLGQRNKQLKSVALTVSSSCTGSNTGTYTSNLTFLELNVADNASDPALLPTLFNKLILPSLASLSIRFHTGADVDWPHEEFMSLLNRSECAIQKLECHDVPFTPLSFYDTLQSLSSLSHLTTSYTSLDPSDISGDLISRLTRQKDVEQPPILPSLTHLDLQLGEFPETLAPLDEMITSRSIFPMDGSSRAVARLEEVNLRLPTPSLADQRRSFTLFKGRGEGWPRVYIWFI